MVKGGDNAESLAGASGAKGWKPSPSEEEKEVTIHLMLKETQKWHMAMDAHKTVDPKIPHTFQCEKGSSNANVACESREDEKSGLDESGEGGEESVEITSAHALVGPPVLDPENSMVDGLAFLGLSLSRATPLGNPNSITHQTAFDFNAVLDRDYEFLHATNDDGWLVGGGEPGPPKSYKLAAKDSAHVEIMRIGTYRPDWGGVSEEDIVSVMSSGKILIPQIEVVPTAVVENSNSPPELEIRFDMEPSVANFDDPDAPLPTNWALRFLHNQLFKHFEFPSRFCPGAFHSTILRKAEFRSPKHREQYFAKCNDAIKKWRDLGPQPLNDGGWGVKGEKLTKGKSEFNSGIWLFLDRANITHLFAPNFLPPYDTPEKRSVIFEFLREEWDEKALTWMPAGTVKSWSPLRNGHESDAGMIVGADDRTKAEHDLEEIQPQSADGDAINAAECDLDTQDATSSEEVKEGKADTTDGVDKKTVTDKDVAEWLAEDEKDPEPLLEEKENEDICFMDGNGENDDVDCMAANVEDAITNEIDLNMVVDGNEGAALGDDVDTTAALLSNGIEESKRIYVDKKSKTRHQVIVQDNYHESVELSIVNLIYDTPLGSDEDEELDDEEQITENRDGLGDTVAEHAQEQETIESANQKQSSETVDSLGEGEDNDSVVCESGDESKVDVVDDEGRSSHSPDICPEGSNGDTNGKDSATNPGSNDVSIGSKTRGLMWGKPRDAFAPLDDDQNEIVVKRDKKDDCACVIM